MTSMEDLMKLRGDLVAFEARNLPPEYQRRLALLALRGWSFRRRPSFYVARWQVLSPEGEGFIYGTLRRAIDAHDPGE